MADLLTHVLVPYVLLTVASWQLTWITRRWIVVGMAGSAIPDLVKFRLLIEPSTVEALVGTPVSYAPISSLGGVIAIAGVTALFFQRNYWQAYSFLVFGGITALVLDGLRVFVDGRSNFWLYPLTWWRPPTPSLYVTSDPRVTVVAIVVASVVYTIDRRQ